MSGRYGGCRGQAARWVRGRRTRGWMVRGRAKGESSSPLPKKEEIKSGVLRRVDERCVR